MGYVFENLVRRFSESYNKEAGTHFTSRDIIYLMSDLLVACDESAIKGDGIFKTIYESKIRDLIQLNDCPLRGVGFKEPARFLC